MADSVWLHNGNYDEEEQITGESKVEDLMECLSFPLTRKQFKQNCSMLLKHISDLETQADKAEDLQTEYDELEQKLDSIGDLLESDSRRRY